MRPLWTTHFKIHISLEHQTQTQTENKIDQPNIHINVKIEDWHTTINCSAGNQSLKWLCLTAVERYRLSRTMNGKVRARENNSPLRRRRPDEDSTFNPLRGLRGSHVPMDIKLKKSFKTQWYKTYRICSYVSAMSSANWVLLNLTKSRS